MLIERHEPLINLGLALYAKLTSDTALRLFRNGDTTVQMAVLAGSSVGVDFGSRSRNPFPSLRPWIDKSGILRELLQSFDDNIELLGFLLSNENMKAAPDQSNQLILPKVASVTGWAVFVGILFAIILIVILIKP